MGVYSTLIQQNISSAPSLATSRPTHSDLPQNTINTKMSDPAQLDDVDYDMLTEDLGLQRVISADGPFQSALDNYKSFLLAIQKETEAGSVDKDTYKTLKRDSDISAMLINLDISSSRFHICPRRPEEESEAAEKDTTQAPEDVSSDDDEDDDEAATKKWAIELLHSLRKTQRPGKVARGIDTLYSGLKRQAKLSEEYEREGLKMDIETANEKLEKYFERFGPLPTDATGGTEDSFVMSPLSRKATEQSMTGSTAAE